MANYVIFDETSKFLDIIVCEENDILPDGYTRQLVPDGYIWDGQQLVRDKYIPVKLESI